MTRYSQPPQSSPGHAIEVVARPGVACPQRERLMEVIRQEMDHHLRAAGRGARGGVRLRIVLWECRADRWPGRVTLYVAGSIGSRPIDRRFTRHTRPRETFKFLAAIGALGAIGARLFAPWLFGRPKLVDMVDCCRECLADFRLTMDQMLGAAGPTSRRLWKGIGLAAWIIALSILALVAAWGVKTGHGTATSVGMGLFLGAGTYGVIKMAALVLMPQSFYRHDPRGQKVMALSGVRSIMAVRMMAGALLMILGGFTLFTLRVLLWGLP